MKNRRFAAFAAFIFFSALGGQRALGDVASAAALVKFLQTAVATPPPFLEMASNRFGFVVLDLANHDEVSGTVRRSFTAGFNQNELMDAGLIPKSDGFGEIALPFIQASNGWFYTFDETQQVSELRKLATRSGRTMMVVTSALGAPAGVSSDVWSEVLSQYVLNDQTFWVYIALHEAFHTLQSNLFAANPIRYWSDGGDHSSEVPIPDFSSCGSNEPWVGAQKKDAVLLRQAISEIASDTFSRDRLIDLATQIVSNRQVAESSCWFYTRGRERLEGTADYFAFELLERSKVRTRSDRLRQVTNFLRGIEDTPIEQWDPEHRSKDLADYVGTAPYVRGHALGLICDALDVKRNWQKTVQAGLTPDEALDAIVRQNGIQADTPSK